MALIPEEMLMNLIKCEINEENIEFREWFLKQFESNDANICSLEEFAVYFLNTLRQYTYVHLNLKTSGTETPKCETPVRTLKSNKGIFEESHQQHNSTPKDNSFFNNIHSKNNTSIEFDLHLKTGRSTSTDRSGLSHNNSTSTPVRRNLSKNSRKASTTPGSTNKSAVSSLCLGDFLVLNTPTNNRSQKRKTTPTTNQQSAQKSQSEKPKKRVQPISISKKVEKSSNSTSSIFAGESSFSNENNILQISNTELEDKDQCAILAARKSLALNTSEITREIKNISMPIIPAVVVDTITTSTPVKEIINVEINIDIRQALENLSLKRLAEIYVIIMDLNLATNILNELSFLLNLLNASNANNALNETCNDLDQLHMNEQASTEKGLSMMEDLTNAVCFAVLCLEHEKLYLASLDVKSLGVILISDRFNYLSDDVQTYLSEIHQRKQQIMAEKPFCDSLLYFDLKACNKVHFQHEQDTRENFSSCQEFTNFRAQRDLFYTCLKVWESNHLNPTWRFCTKITPSIREIFDLSENCINMAHLAKLFVSQLLLSVSNTSTPEEIGLDVDLQKLSKLTQRLIAPSQFSVDYQFPRAEAFFRDFILEARSLAFVEQLKIELYTQLITQHDSSLDYININKAENDAKEKNVSSLLEVSPNNHIIVRPDILNSMIILAKFLGFTTSLPYNINSSSVMPAEIERNQVKLRSLMQPTFDVSLLLEQAIEQNKLLIAIPWSVQYFAMLDNITLQLDNYIKAIKLLFALYSYMGLENSKPVCNTSMFIIQLCLGWLFESKQFIAEQYYNYRAMLREKKSTVELNLVRSKLRCNMLGCSESESYGLNPYLESILPIACPFLAEFRVSIMPAKYAQTKYASRTGRYRHITTRIAKMPNTVPTKTDGYSSSTEENCPRDTQNFLLQAFLHSQNTSTREVIKFCTERCYKSAVKDGQLKILLPNKTNADNLVNQITSFQYHFVYNSIKTIYDEALTRVKEEWNECIPKILHKRIINALESLLPEETSLVLKKTYFIIIEKEAAFKMSEWFSANVTTEYFLCTNLQELTNKICSANQNKVQLGSNQLIITTELPSLSDLIDELQYWLHCTSVRVERFKDSKPLILLFSNLIKSFENKLPSFLYHSLGAAIIQLFQCIIAKHSSHLTNELIEVACQVLLHPNMQEALDSCSSSGICIYDALLTITFIESLGTKTECFRQLAHLIIALIKKQVITVNYVNELFVSIFKHEWHPLALSEISNILMYIAKETAEVPQKPRRDNNAKNKGNESSEEDDSDYDNEKSNLFMEMLADLSRDVDFF